MAQGSAGLNILSNKVSIADSANLDAFSRVRVSQSLNLFDSQFTYDLQPLLWEQITSGVGASIARDTTNNVATLTFASTPTGGSCYMQTFEHFRYVSGKGQCIFQTFNLNGGVANCLKFVGYSDGTNGIEFRLNGTTAQFAVLSSTTGGNEVVPQSVWNIDKLDGTGASGITLDLTKTQILVIDFQALYVGRVRVGFDINGSIFYAHQFTHANSNTHPYLKTANLPLRCGMACAGTVSTTLTMICATVTQEGGTSDLDGFHFTQSGTVTAASGARTHLLSIQPRLTFNSVTNRTKFLFEGLDLVVTGSNPVKWELCLGDAITGTTTFNDVNTTYSGMAYNTGGTTSGTPDIIMDTGYAPASNQSKGSGASDTPIRYPICLNAAGAVRTLGRITLLVTGLGGTSAVQAAINWKEIR